MQVRIRNMENQNTQGNSGSNKGNGNNGGYDKKKKIFLCGMGVFVAVAVIAIFAFSGSKEEPVEVLPEETPVVEEQTPTEIVPEEEVVEPTQEEKAIQHLENPDQELTAEESAEARAAMQRAFDFLKEFGMQEYDRPGINKELNSTATNFISQLQIGVSNGYVADVENARFFKADNEGIIQCSVVMKKDGEQDVVILGNYIAEIKEFNFKKMTGSFNMQAMLSPGGGPQALEQ